MKILQLVLILSMSIGSARAESVSKVALVFTGGGFKTAMFLGMLKGVKDAGHKPDVIIGTCGGSISAAIAHVIPEPHKQLEFVQSVEFYHLLTSIDFTDRSGVGKMLSLARKFYTKYKWNRKIPNIFEDYLMDVPKEINIKEMSKSFEPLTHRTVMVAAKILFTPENVGVKRDKGEDLFEETIFTDKRTAEELKDFTSPTARSKNSSVSSKINLITDANLDQAARASISDPFYMAPGEYKGDLYLTGGVDLYPIELAKKLAKKIIFVYPPTFSVVERGAIFATFNFSPNKRHKRVFEQDVDYLIDSTDFPEKLELEPKLSLIRWKINSRIPESYEEYREIVKGQFHYGYYKAVVAMKK
jgi:predicted acylesterase/phospholipase RssA